MKTSNVILAITLFFCVNHVKSQETGTFTDVRDNKTYKTVKINSLVWMGENLNFITPKESWCYGNDSLNGEKFGRLYTFESAKNACPSGWHLPIESDWQNISNSYGFREIAGKHMKEVGVNNWRAPNSDATNKSGFTALPGGAYFVDENKFVNIGYVSFFWVDNVPEEFPNSAYIRGLFYDKPIVFVDSYVGALNGLSVRCVKD
ncbi:MAG: FISUMP domain-containing protein [Bacteroidota bacterium]